MGKKKGKQDKLQKELQEWEAQQDPKELNAAALKVQAAQRQKQAKKEGDQKKKERFHTAKTSPLSPRDKKGDFSKTRTCPTSPKARKGEEEVDPEEFNTPEHEAVATKIQAIQRGKIARKQTQELRESKG